LCEQGEAPKTAGARFASSERYLGTRTRVEPANNTEEERDIYGAAVKRRGVLENGRIDHDGKAKGLFAGLPNKPGAGELKKDFQLPRYGEYDVAESTSKMSTLDSSKGGERALWMDSPKPLLSPSEMHDGSLPPLLSAGVRTASLRSPPSSPLAPDVHSFRTGLSRDSPRTPRSARLYFDGQGEGDPPASMRSPLGSLGSADSIDSKSDASPKSKDQNARSVVHHHRHQHRHRTYMTRKPASKWKELQVPDFYLKTLEGCSTGHIPSMFFEKEPAVSTAGNIQVSPFHDKPLPTDPTHRSASKEYFAPKGFGNLHCNVCTRNFLSEELLAQHKQSTLHQYKEAQQRGQAQRSPPPTIPILNLMDCGEFDDSYHAINSDSVGRVSCVQV